MRRHDVLIVGAGPVGLSLALALAESGLDIVLADARDIGAAVADPRVLALSHGSRLTLERLGVWSTLDATPIETIHVSQEGGFGRTVIRARELGVPALGYVCAAGSLTRALRTEADRRGIPTLDHTEVADTRCGKNLIQADLRCDDPSDESGSRETRLLVRAEGGTGSGAEVTERTYGQCALVATVELENEHGRVAFERFTAEGPIALLPFAHDCSLVHVVADRTADHMIALNDTAYLDLLQSRFGNRVRLRAVRGRTCVPLGLRYRKNPVEPRCVWIGNAAQTLHPVAGQGFNLALRDVWTLADALRLQPGDPGDTRVLAAYARRRNPDRLATIGFTDGLIRLFGNDNTVLRHFRGAGLFALDVVPPLRNFVARRMIFGARAWP